MRIVDQRVERADRHGRWARACQPATGTRSPGWSGARPPRRARSGGTRWRPPAAWTRRALDAAADAVVHLAGAPVAAGRWTDARKREIRDSRIVGHRGARHGARGGWTSRRPCCCPDRPSAATATPAAGRSTSPRRPGTGFLADLVTGLGGGRRARPGRRDPRRAPAHRHRAVPRRAACSGRLLPPFRLGLGARLGPGTPVHELDRAGRRGPGDPVPARPQRHRRAGQPDRARSRSPTPSSPPRWPPRPCTGPAACSPCRPRRCGWRSARCPASCWPAPGCCPRRLLEAGGKEFWLGGGPIAGALAAEFSPAGPGGPAKRPAGPVLRPGRRSPPAASTGSAGLVPRLRGGAARIRSGGRLAIGAR